MAKTRSELVTQSNNTFQDGPPANITPPNHRQFNEDSINSAVMQNDDNLFQGENTFQQKIVSSVGAGFTAFESVDGYIVLNNGGIQMPAGDLEVGGNSTLGYTFVETLQQKFKTAPIVVGPTISTLDLTGADGNILYIEGDATLTDFTTDQIGIIYYAIFVGTCKFFFNGTNILPPCGFVMYPNDILVFTFTESNVIRVLARHRATNEVSGQLNGQNFYTCTTPEDALFLQTYGMLDVGATYKVPSAINIPYNSSYLWDVYLKAERPNGFETTCYVKSNDNNNIFQKALFAGDFTAGSILITDSLDASTLTLTWANIQDNVNTQFMVNGSKAFVRDDFGTNFNGNIHFSTFDNTPQVKNILNLQDQNTMNFGRIKNSYNFIDPTPYFFKNSGSGVNEWGNNAQFEYGGISGGAIIAYNTNFGNDILDSLSLFGVFYTVVNDIVTVSVRGKADTTFTMGVSGKEFWLYFPLPFALDALYAGGGTGSVNFDELGNESDQGGICYPSEIDAWSCLFRSKHKQIISNLTGINFAFTFTYQTYPNIADE